LLPLHDDCVEIVIAPFMLVMAVGIAAIWTGDIRAGRGYESSRGLLAARDPVNGNRMLPHWLAEYTTAVALVIGAAALMLHWSAADALAAFAMGALCYTSLNSLAWVLGAPERRAYALPMIVGLIGGLVSITLVVAL
jgi:hypothetical protein